MFTGLIETIGTVRSFHQSGAYYTLKIDAAFSGELVIGQSVSVSGACLTVTRNDSKTFDVEMMRETFIRTWFGKGLHAGTRVNLERALRLTDRLDGHLVRDGDEGGGIHPGESGASARDSGEGQRSDRWSESDSY